MIIIILYFDTIVFFYGILSLHHTFYYFNRCMLFIWDLDAVRFWPFAIELYTWQLPVLVDTITCLQMVRGNHRKFAITVQNCKCSLLISSIFIHITYFFSSISDSEWYRAIVWNSGTPFQKVSALYCNYYYYGFICLVVFIRITYYLVSVLESISSTKTRNNI